MPVSTASTTPLGELLSERAKSRVNIHFTGLACEGVVPHPEPVSLAGGMPNVGLFPIKQIKLVYSETPFDIENSDEIVIERYEADIEGDQDRLLSLERGLQYAKEIGHTPLLEFSRELIEEVNPPKYDNWDVIISCGSGDSLHKVCNLLINPGDTVLVEEYTFVPVVALIRNYGGYAVPVKLNLDPQREKGEKRPSGCIDVPELANLLDSWETGPYKGLRKPKFLYTIPTGQNPTGLVQSMSDRKKILEIAKTHNFVILEDDPYGNIAYPDYSTNKDFYEKEENRNAAKYMEEMLYKSYLTLDTEGRVIRLETFSKLFAPGLRLGFIVANNLFISQIAKHTNASTRAASGVSQTVLASMLYSKRWQGIEDSSASEKALSVKGAVNNWLTWGMKISRAYTEKRNLMLDMLYSHEIFTKKGYATVLEPQFGMFMVIRLNLSKITNDSTRYRDLMHIFNIKTLEKGVHVVLGLNMAFDPKIAESERSCFLRLTNASAADTKLLRVGIERVISCITELFEENLNTQ
ncbi:LAFE_0G10132g1_1 [Lachancea fermentati]|uniref:LAFE_0G10132g1_1 n=1 Tax=Lachancea fermentati TaxID=4955 RepID=A0A1G4MI54_LACFM|nr:LAFE_0G10132g1_1 [Lachancea fermentati]